MARAYWGCSTSCFTYSVFIQVIREKTLANILLAIWQLFLYENNQNYNSSRVINKFAFILLLSFLTDQKQDSDFQQVGGLLTRNITDLCLERVLFYFKAMPNSAEFYKGVFLHVIPIRIIVPWQCYWQMRKKLNLWFLNMKLKMRKLNKSRTQSKVALPY